MIVPTSLEYILILLCFPLAEDVHQKMSNAYLFRGIQKDGDRRLCFSGDIYCRPHGIQQRDAQASGFCRAAETNGDGFPGGKRFAYFASPRCGTQEFWWSRDDEADTGEKEVKHDIEEEHEDETLR